MLLAPTWIQKIDWIHQEVMVELNCDVIQTAPAYERDKVISEEYQQSLIKHYGMKSENLDDVK